MIRWIREVIPRTGWAIVFLAAYGLLHAAKLTASRGLSSLTTLATGAYLDELTTVQLILVLNAAIGYGVYRSGAFDPLYRRDDCYNWLRTTPWRPGRALPQGPVWPVWQDVLVLAALSYLSWDLMSFLSIPGYLAALLAMGSYLVFKLPPLTTNGPKWCLYVVASGMVACLLFLHEPMVLLLLLAALCGVCGFGLQMSLSRLWDWEETTAIDWNRAAGRPFQFVADQNAQKQAQAAALKSHPGQQTQKWMCNGALRRFALGEPLALNAPLPERRGRALADKILLSVLAGFAYAFLCLQVRWFAEDEASVITASTQVSSVLLIMGGGALALTRLYYYQLQHAAPISILGRIATGRLVIPGYDKVFIGPLVIAAVAAGLPAMLGRIGVPFEAAGGVSVTLVLLAYFLIPPSLRSWQLTGTHRMRRKPFGAANQLTRVA